ncbi:MAG: hypothetical protein NTV49_09350 [Kiritimatiellaeota bacterium]|nr:hypothetical protein [Kiritimatiellota bacterium]
MPRISQPDAAAIQTHFDVHVEERYAVCPAGQRSSNCSRLEVQRTGQVDFRIEWSKTVCQSCPLCDPCVSTGQDHRTFVVGALHALLQGRRLNWEARQASDVDRVGLLAVCG